MSNASRVRITTFGEGRHEFAVMNGAATVGDGLRAGSIETKGRRLAVNGHPADLGTRIRPGDEVTVVPRVEGG